MYKIDLRSPEDEDSRPPDTRKVIVGEFVASIKKLNVKEGDVLVLKGEGLGNLLEDLAQELVRRKMHHLLVHLPDDGKIESIPPGIMANYGWFRDTKFIAEDYAETVNSGGTFG